MQLTVRLVESDDIMKVFDWANDSLSRSFSFSNDPIPFDVHNSWFKEKINSSNCLYLILLADGEAAGQIRYDIKEKDYIISFTIDPKFRGKGLGSAILRLGEQYLFEKGYEKTIQLVGYVKKENLPSIISFEKNGYAQSSGDNNIGYQEALVFKKILNITKK